MLTGILFDIQRFSLHDGPGIRTTVFFKGCNMRCAWCHNPESFLMCPQLRVNYQKCTHCAACVEACPQGAHEMVDGRNVFHREKCSLCTSCISACPTGALSQIGREYTVQEVMDVVLRDRLFYEKSGGGVTFSGGEATLQPSFLMAMLKECKSQGIHTCIETNGMIPKDVLAGIIDMADLYLVDFKMHTQALYHQYTGMAGDQLVDTLDMLAALHRPVVFRCPVIPGINDTDAFFDAVVVIRDRYPNIQKAEIMPYHNTGVGKWQAVGLHYTLADIKNPRPETIAQWQAKIGGKDEDQKEKRR